MAEHPDVEYAIEDTKGDERIFNDPKEAHAFAMDVALSQGEAILDVLIYSEDGAAAYGGEDAVEEYNENPDASVFERFEIKVHSVGSVD